MIDKRGERRLTETAQFVLSALLSAGALQGLLEKERSALQVRVAIALERLQHILDQRHEVDLGRIAVYTAGVDEYIEHMNHHGVLTTNVTQQDAMPMVLWGWSNRAYMPVKEEFARAQGAFIAATGNAQRAADYVRRHFVSDGELFAWGPYHVMVLYAERLDAEFQAFMRELFGDSFKNAPVKGTRRIHAKLKADLENDGPAALLAAFDDPELAAANCEVRSLCHGLADVVRGSVTAEGADEMIRIATELRNSPRDAAGRSFSAWRVKNTHHATAVVVGGYRDVKILGVFTATVGSERMSMVVEIQIIDSVFLEIKRHMHKVYAIDRGDFF